MVLGILAHVDAGKTTLSEALLFEAGKIRKLGRVDHQDAYLDTDAQERARGITIFSKEARLEFQGRKMILLDTPGHVDFSAEMERVLSCLDYAVLVISGSEGVQGHTRTLWKLLNHYHIPVFLFVNKMDLLGEDREAARPKLQQELKEELSDACVDMTDYMSQSSGRQNENTEELTENIAVCSEEMLNTYMETMELPDELIARAVCERKLFPCYYGSALKLDGVVSLMEGLTTFAPEPSFPDKFAARVYKITRDARGARLTHLKITGGSLKVREKLEYEPQASENTPDLVTEKADQIRRYSGEKYETTEEAPAGDIVAVTGLTLTFPGQGLGAEADIVTPVLEPVLNYQLLLPREISPLVFMEKLRLLEEEDPKLRIVWDPEVKEIHVQLMGQVQMEVLAQSIRERFGVPVAFGPGSIVYKETIAAPVEGVGHFEPLRHYAEAHLLLSPGEPGSGITVDSVCSEDVLDRNWQRLIATHVTERVHKGVLTGSALTDVHMTIVTGRAHPKHTEGGDFRQATYRAIRQGLKSTQSILLEPYYSFTLEVPSDFTGRALTDLEQRFGKVEAPEFLTKGTRDMSVIRGKAPVATMQDYINEVHAYTQGLGSLMLEVCGYGVCHNPEEVIANAHYDSELDFRNPTGSVFCAHGSGYAVPWDEVPQLMHMEYVFPPEKLQMLWENRNPVQGGEADPEQDGTANADSLKAGTVNADSLKSGSAADWLKAGLAGGMNRVRSGKGFAADEAEALSGTSRRNSWEKSVSRMSEVELDAELADVYAREFGMSKEDMEEQERKKWQNKKKINGIPEGLSGKPRKVKYDQHGNPIYPKAETRKEFLIIDGYNIIFSWDELKELSKANIDAAREKLIDIISNYQGYKKIRVAIVFDAYKVKDNSGKSFFYDGVSKKMLLLNNKKHEDNDTGIEIIYTRTDEIADARIERMVHDNIGKFRITVATNDGLEQLTILSQGALRMPARELQNELENAAKHGLETFRNMKQ